MHIFNKNYKYTVKKSHSYKTHPRGFSILELMVVISILTFVIISINPNKWINFFYKSNTAMNFHQESRSLLLKMERIMKQNCTVIQADSNKVILTNAVDSYTIYIMEDILDEPPYSIGVIEGVDPVYTISKHIAKLTDPDRAGLEFKYFDQDFKETAVTKNIRTIQVLLSFKKEEQTYSVISSLAIPTNNIVVISR